MKSNLSQDQIRSMASALDQSEKTRVQIRPASISHPGFSIAEAYAVQNAWVELMLADGKRRIHGMKIGLTSRAMQMSAGINEPDSGVLMEDMFHNDGVVLDLKALIVPKVEVELAFVLGEDLGGPNCTMFDVLDAAKYVIPALEIIDSRYYLRDDATGKGRQVVDTISDNACNCAVVLGGRAVRPKDVDLRWVSAICSLNGNVEETGVAAGVLNNPLNGISWLANKIAPNNQHLKRGQIVLAGSFTRPIFAKPGDQFQVDYGPLGTVNCGFR